MNTLLALRNGLILALAVCAMTACTSDNDDLDQYINTIKAKPGGFIEPLPEITPYEIFTYVADAEQIRSPFIPDTPQANATGAGRGPRPDADRSPEFLEGFPLDTLRMVGTLDIGNTMYGLVQTSDGLIHRVVPGNFMGQNDGRITGITESEIDMVEIISDGIGGYIERDAAISLSD
jgi:type IV pilus assembly protein PilP